MNAEEAFKNYCSAMTFRVRNKHTSFQPREKRRERLGQRNKTTSRTGETETEETAESGGQRTDRRGVQSSTYLGQGLSVQPAPLQLVAMLRLKAFSEKMRRDAEAELPGPCACRACEEEQASLALTTFICRRKTQLQLQKHRRTDKTPTSD